MTSVPTVAYFGDEALSASSFSVPADASIQAGDLRLLWVSVSNTTITSPDAGWTELVNYTLATTRKGYLYRRNAGASEGSSSFGFGLTANYSWAQVAVRGADLSAALDFTPTTAQAASGTALTATGGTTAQDNELLLVAYHLLTNSGAATLTVPSGMTQVLQQPGNGSAGHLVGVFSESRPTAGATGNRASTASTSAPWGAVLLAVPPAPDLVLPPLQRPLSAAAVRAAFR